ncbi:MAG: 2-oxoacid:acceptor oxidoreductase family protein [Coriobacteriales bacterium]|nr:2-oxoacid:acceptor oxidoreductase family protein [Coriobacteriales bacterium]
MQNMTEIRWHARAGQGAVTASKLVAETALLKGRYIQAMPEYGPERTGAPLRAFTRISDAPIEVHNNITDPDIVVVLDHTLLDLVDVLEGIKPDGTLIINSLLAPEEVRVKLNIPAGIKVATVDASGIAVKLIKRDIPNTPICGALAAVTGGIEIDALKEQLLGTFGKKFSQEIIDANLQCVDEAAKEVKVA